MSPFLLILQPEVEVSSSMNYCSYSNYFHSSGPSTDHVASAELVSRHCSRLRAQLSVCCVKEPFVHRWPTAFSEVIPSLNRSDSNE